MTYDPKMQNYTEDKPQWVEILPGHFILANQQELDIYRKELEA